jgi:ATP-dependent Clp protease, protease subunit
MPRETIPEITLYGVIDSDYGVGPAQFRDDLLALGKVDTLRLRINSPGGSVFDSFAIYNLLKSSPAKVIVTVDGVAASGASIVAMAGDTIEMAQGAFMMIHSPVNLEYGDADAMRQMAELLDKVTAQLVDTYAKRTKQPVAKIAEMLQTDTWLTPFEAIELGFADRSVDTPAIAASADLRRFKNVPKSLLTDPQNQGENPVANTPATNPESIPAPAATQTTTAGPQAASYAELKAGLPGADAEFICSQLAAAATLPVAQTAWMAEQARRLEAANQAAAAAQNAASNKPKGVQPLGQGKADGDNAASGDPIAEWDKLVAANMGRGMKKADAVRAAVHSNPELHNEYIAAYNR